MVNVLQKKINLIKNSLELSRQVYKSNDERARIKLSINNAFGSNIKEVKSHEEGDVQAKTIDLSFFEEEL